MEPEFGPGSQQQVSQDAQDAQDKRWNAQTQQDMQTIRQETLKGRDPGRLHNICSTHAWKRAGSHLIQNAARPWKPRNIQKATRSGYVAILTAALVTVSLAAMSLSLLPTSPAYAATGVSTPVVTVSSSSADAGLVTYRISFTVSSTNGALAGGTGTIALVGPAGTSWPTTASDYIIEDSTTASGSGTASQVNVVDNGMVAIITVPNNIDGGDSLTVKVEGSTNPLTPGTYQIGVETSSDPALVTSNSYTITSATSVSSPTLTLSTTSANATGVSYYVDFSLSATGELVGGQGTITLTAPEGTVWPSTCQGGSAGRGFSIEDTTDPSAGGVPTACQVVGASVILTVPNTISASDSLSVTASGVVNPPAESNVTIGVSTSSDTNPVNTSPSYSIQPFTSISGLDVTPSTTAAGAHDVSYVVSFSTSNAGELMAGQGTISLSFAGAWWPNASSNYTIYDTTLSTYHTASGTGSPASPQSGEGAGAVITVPFTILPGDQVQVIITGMINPPSAAGVAFSVSTSSDQAPASIPISITPANPVSNVSTAATSFGTGSSAVSGYNVTFTTSSTGELAPGYITATAGTSTTTGVPGVGTITLVSSAELTPPSGSGNVQYCVEDTTNGYIYNSTASIAAAGLSASQEVVTLIIGDVQGTASTSGQSFCATASNSGQPPAPSPPIAAGDTVQVSLETSTSGATFSVETSSDVVPPSTIQPPSPSTGAPTVILSPTSSAGAMSTYTISFTAPSLLYGQNSNAPASIELIFPPGTVFTNCSGGSNTTSRVEFTGYCPPDSFSITDSTLSSGSGTGTIIGLGANDTVVSIPIPNTIEAGDQVSLSLGSVQNPPAGTYYIGMYFVGNSIQGASMISTSSYTIDPATSVTTPKVSLSTTAANATGVTYDITFSVSGSGALLGTSNLMGQVSTISLTATPGTIWPTNQSDWSFVNNTAQGPKVPLGGFGLSVSVSTNGSSVGQIVMPKSVEPGDSLTLVITDVTNPPQSTGNTVSVSTSSDTVPVASSPYTSTAPVSAGLSVKATSDTAAANGVTYTLSMTASPTGKLTGGQGLIYVSMGNGTTLPTSPASYNITDSTTSSGSGQASRVSAYGPNAVITVANTIEPGDSISLAISGVTNPTTTGTDTVTVWTSSDMSSISSNSITVVKPSSPVNPVMYMSSTSADQSNVTYTIDFNTSSSGALGTTSTITLLAPSDTNFSSSSFSATVVDDTNGQTITSRTSAITLSGGFSMVNLDNFTSNVAAGSTLTITLSNVTNPPVMGSFTLSTSSDASPATVTMPTISTPTVTGVSPVSGTITGGYNVTITGTGFNLATKVSFGSSPANFTISSTTSLIATAPKSGSVTVDITVTNPAGTSATSSDDKFTFVPTNSPTAPAEYTPVSPLRLADTRCSQTPKPSFCASENLPSQNAALGTISPHASIDVTVTGVDSIPSSGTTAVALNVTLIGPTTHSGYLSVYPASSSGSSGPTPTISNINWNSQGIDVPNLVIVAVGQSGQVSIYNGSSGTINVAIDVEGFFSTTASSGTTYNPMTPVRLADTRCSQTPKPSFCASENLPSQNAALKTLTAASPQESVTVAGVDHVPAGASAVVLNVTAVNTTSSGFLTVWPAGKPRATVSNLNWVAGKDVANRVTVPVGAGGAINVYDGSAGSVNFIVDISGFYTSTGGTSFQAVSPIRICDTRSDAVTTYVTECSADGALAAGKVLSVQVAGVDGIIPSTGVTAVVANVTAVGSTAAGGFLSVLPGGTTVSASSPPSISDLNWGEPGWNVANLVVAKLGPSGNIEIYNSSGNTNVIVDVMGWYS